MTLFLVIFIIFAIVAFSSSQQRKNKIGTYHLTNKSNAPLQYDLACKTVELMGQSYRRHTATLGINTLLNGNNFTCDVDTASKYNVDLEKKWLYVTSLACGFKGLDNNSLSVVYGQDIWEFIPEEISNDFIKAWKRKFNVKINSDWLNRLLTSSISLKKAILLDTKGCYYSYRNKEAIDLVAKEFEMPDSSELKTLKMSQCYSLLELASWYASIKIMNNGYSPVALSDIRINPTAKQREIQGSILSEHEKIIKESKERMQTYKKYFK